MIPAMSRWQVAEAVNPITAVAWRYAGCRSIGSVPAAWWKTWSRRFETRPAWDFANARWTDGRFAICPDANPAGANFPDALNPDELIAECAAPDGALSLAHRMGVGGLRPGEG